MNFDAWHFVEIFLTQPVLIVVGETSESRWHSERLQKNIDGKSNNLRMVVVLEGRHMDFSGKDVFINRAIKVIAEFRKPVILA
jgi:pimeloyl-ACP methyl ester carboxylesterase